MIVIFFFNFDLTLFALSCLLLACFFQTPEYSAIVRLLLRRTANLPHPRVRPGGRAVQAPVQGGLRRGEGGALRAGRGAGA